MAAGGLQDLRQAKGFAADAPELVIEGTLIAGGFAVSSELDDGGADFQADMEALRDNDELVLELEADQPPAEVTRKAAAVGGRCQRGVNRTIGIARPDCSACAASCGAAPTCCCQSRSRSGPSAIVAEASNWRPSTSTEAVGLASRLWNHAGSA